MEKPKILGQNLAGCAFTGPTAALWVSVSFALKVGGMAAVAAVCNAPAVGLVYAVGQAA